LSGEREEHLCQSAGKRTGMVVFKVDFTVKLLRACVWMPRRKQAKKDVASCEKLRGAANRL
jgi:hypothetical protein